MINTFLNNYFGFNRQQRNGLLVLICISLFLLVVRLVYPYFIEPDDMIVRNLKIISSVADSMEDTGTTIVRHDKKLLVNFDPNTVTLDEMISLGFSSKTAATLQTFRAKGFKFNKKEDLLKVYGVSETFFRELEPFIVIEGHAQKQNKFNNPVVTAIQNREKVELNGADSLSLLNVNGIGPVFAKRILKYREILGGYVDVEQLKEVYGFTDENYQKVKSGVSVNSALARKIHINSDEFKVVNKHPYISYEQTKEVFNFRQKTPLTEGNIGSVLKDEKLTLKLMPYLAFD